MFEFFDSVLGAIETALNFLYNIINALLTAVDVITNAAVLPTKLAVFLPGIIGSAILVAVSLGVVKFLVGR